jgi:hypothetical protein
MNDHAPEAAHAASELDDYEDAAPEGFALSSLFVVAAVMCIAIAAWAVLA